MPDPAPLTLGWATDLAVLRLGGSEVTDHGDHLVVRTPQNPDFYWGNFLLARDAERANDVEHCLGLFRSAFPGATHVAIGLLGRADPTAWGPAGVEIGTEDVLVATSPPQVERPAGYQIAQFHDDASWAQAADFIVAQTLADLGFPASGMTPAQRDHVGVLTSFERRRVATRRALADSGRAAFFGAFADGQLVSDLGIVLLDPDPGGGLPPDPQLAGTARYQTIRTHPAHRRRGLASALIAHAARWAQQRGALRFVLVADAGTAAAKLYRGLGFQPAAWSNNVYRPG